MNCRKPVDALAFGLALCTNAAVAATRDYYIAAEDEVWDFAPSNQNLMHCHSIGGCPVPEPWTACHTFAKVRYIEYTEASSKVWWYHSRVDEAANVNAGLLGAITITKEGKARHDGSPRDVDREFVIAFMVFDELGGEEPGLMHAMNGYIFGNLKGLVMKNGERVRWHVLGMGNEVDMHSAHWHGKTLTVGRHEAARRTDVIELMPASMATADMKADNPGEWMFHCHVADHINAGMMTSYEILP